MERKVRYKIKAGSKRVGIEVHNDILRYIRLSSQFIGKRAFTDITDYDAVLRIWEACHARKRASIFSCVDGSGHDLASAILIWDDRHLYYWLSCRDPEVNDSAANSILIWNAIEFSQKAGLIFDMDGYATPDAGVFLSRFGLLPHRRFDISMINSAARLRAAFSSHVVGMVGPGLQEEAAHRQKCHLSPKSHPVTPDGRLRNPSPSKRHAISRSRSGLAFSHCFCSAYSIDSGMKPAGR